uniref:WD repeat-containing protein 61 n=1 Tax=Aceria tosichella TaxID=561515 RepID=A0A6G1S419_9ACAR
MGCYSVLKQHEHAHDDAIWTVSWVSPTSIITGSLDTTAKVWNLQTQVGDLKLAEDRVFDGFALGVISTDVAPRSSVVAIAAMDSKIRLLDLAQPAESCELKIIDASPVDSWKIKFSADGKQIATGSISGKINLYSTNPGSDTTRTQLDAGKFAYSVDFSPDGRLLAAGNVAGIVSVFDLETQKLLTNIDGHALPVRSIAFSPDSNLLISGCDDTQIKIHDPRRAESIKTLSGHASWILDLNFAPNGSHFASGSSDKSVKIWDMTSFECIQTFGHHANQVTGVRYDPNGSRLASVSDDSSIVIYEHIK